MASLFSSNKDELLPQDLRSFAFIYLLYLICFVDFKKIPKFDRKYFDKIFILFIYKS